MIDDEVTPIVLYVRYLRKRDQDISLFY